MIPLVRSSFIQWFWRRFADCFVGIFGGRSAGRFLGGFSGGVWKFILWKVCESCGAVGNFVPFPLSTSFFRVQLIIYFQGFNR